MESEVASSFETPVFKPTMAEFANFKTFIKKIEQENENISFAKVIFSTLCLAVLYSVSLHFFLKLLLFFLVLYT